MARGFNHKLEQQQAPAFFARGPSAFARLVFFSALSMTLMATDSRLQYLGSLRQNLVTALHPLQVLANTPIQLYNATSEYFSTHHHLLNENQQLKQQALKRNIDLQRLNTLALENKHLRELLQTHQALVESSVLGEIMHVGRDPFTKKVIVNRGEKHHISAGEAVVDATGVIGQVTRVYPSSSEVTLITDKSLAIPIQIERNGLRAIAFGHGRDSTLDLPYLPANVDIRRGDTLVTSGIDGIYPAGLAVAKVSQIEITADSPFAHIVCVPTGGVENHRQVLLVSIPRVEILPKDALNSQPNADLDTKSPSTIPEKTTVKTQEKLIARPSTTTSVETSTIAIPQTNSATTSLIKPAIKLPENPQPNTTSKPHAPQ
ncbi:MAG TPA: rod shape-determining protein MreC [Methylotenera sp.]|nr:rod shape-determining protein MreC [Methylotenera sp.]